MAKPDGPVCPRCGLAFQSAPSAARFEVGPFATGAIAKMYASRPRDSIRHSHRDACTGKLAPTPGSGNAMNDPKQILVERDTHVVRVTINRP